MKVPDSILPSGWSQSYDGMVLTCPHGNRIETDGKGPCGCVSPLLEGGLI